jgi:hypothetical protein
MVRAPLHPREAPFLSSERKPSGNLTPPNSVNAGLLANIHEQERVACTPAALRATGGRGWVCNREAFCDLG